MAVTLNVAANATGAAVGTLNTLPVVAAGSNIAALVSCEYRDVIGSLGAPAFVLQVTLTGFSGTPTFVQLRTSGARTVEQYQVTGGSAGAQTCNVLWDDLLGTPSVLADVGVVVLNNVHQGTPIGAVGTGAATSTAPSATCSGTIAGSMVVNGVCYDNITAATATVGGAATQDWNATVGSVGQGRIRGLGSHVASAGGAVAMTWTITASRAWVSAAVEMLEAASSILQDPITSPGLVPFAR